MSTTISKSTLQFLKDLENNNNRPWFNDNKDYYTAAHENMIAFAEKVIDEMSHHDNLIPMTGFRLALRAHILAVEMNAKAEPVATDEQRELGALRLRDETRGR